MPIALLPEMAKIQERLAYDQLLSYLESKKLFTPRQECYRKGHSTQKNKCLFELVYSYIIDWKTFQVLLPIIILKKSILSF